MLLCGLDLESTGLCVKNDRIIEIGVVLWDTDRQVPVQLVNELVNPKSMAVSEDITAITGINQSDIDTFGIKTDAALTSAGLLMAAADAIVAHNGTEFDMPLLRAEFDRFAFPWPETPWIDTMLDVPYPPSVKTRNLRHLAAEHGFLNPFPHRALSDVLTMLKVLSHYDADEVLAVSKLPNVRLVAECKKPWQDLAPDGKKEVDLAKARGFRFDGSTKRWLKNVKENLVAAEMEHGEFVVKRA